MVKQQLKEFLNFHEGKLNKVIHILGFAILGLGILEKNLALVIVGGVTQELGHFYQYARTKREKDSPWHGLKSQSIFAIPIFILIVLYVAFAK